MLLSNIVQDVVVLYGDKATLRKRQHEHVIIIVRGRS